VRARGVAAAAGLLAVSVLALGGPARTAERTTQAFRPVEAAFEQRSYRPGARVRLVLWSRERDVRVQLFRAGLEAPGQRARSANEMRGSPVSEPRRLTWRRPLAHTRIGLELGIWPSGLYFARVTSGRRVGYAPFVIRPETLGENRVAVVLPTYTWQAYNLRDLDRNGSTGRS
jgi:N,N-dimethylformamidase beta subunit-like, C-terminal